MTYHVITEIILYLLTFSLLIPCAVYFLQCSLALIGNKASSTESTTKNVDFAVIVPAHNEEYGIGDTVRHLARQLDHGQRLLVVADNCCDNTAIEAKIAGAEVWIRTNQNHRGKGYAIAYAVDRLKTDPPNAIVVIDADCRISDHGLSYLAQAALRNRRPVQAQYLLTLPPNAGLLLSISSLAFMIRNFVRPIAMHRVGLPCHLTGSGMAFPWNQLRDAPRQQGNLVEDLTMGLELAIAGFPPKFVPEVLVESEHPAETSAASSQRRRWEHGQLSALVEFAPKLIREACRQRRPALAALAADLLVPPLALLSLLVFVVAVFAGWAYMAGTSSGPFLLVLAEIALVAGATISVWARFGRKLVSLGNLILAPVYIVWKLPLYISYLSRRRQSEWVRTPRNEQKCADNAHSASKE